jgi:hypothetical protein
MPDSPATTDPVAGELLLIRAAAGRGAVKPATVRSLLAAVEALLGDHRIEPLYAHADEGECGCPVPTEASSVDEDIWYEGEHPEGRGPEGTGLVCRKKIAGHWCPGCGDVAVEHGCFEVPKAYPPEKCPIRGSLSRALLGEGETSD